MKSWSFSEWLAGLFAPIQDLKSVYDCKKAILMNEIERLVLRILAIGHVTDSEAQYQKLAMKNQIFAVFTLNKKLLSENKKGKNPQENFHWTFISYVTY